MRKSFLLLVIALAAILLGCAGDKKEKVIVFSPLSETDFDFAADSSYSVPKGKMWDERKKMHDSCMGSEFPANAMFIRKKDTFRLGTIVNKRTMKIVKKWDMRSFAGPQFVQMFGVVTKPCYEKMPVHTSVDSFFNKKIILKLPGVADNINSELNNTILHSANTQVQMGSWFNAELTSALGEILDTTKNASQLAYKKFLLDSNNIVLVRSSSITDFTFYIHANGPISKQLQAILKRKPDAFVENANFRAQLFYLDENSFELSFSGMFQMMGQFMKCGLQ